MSAGKVPGLYKNGQKQPLMPEPQGVLVGVISQELSRFSGFFQSLLGVMATLPAGSGLSWAKSVDVPGNCNSLCRHMMNNGNWRWLWLMGDDHIFDRDIVARLASHDVDVIVPHCLKRYPPWHPVVYGGGDADGLYYTAELPEEGLTEIHAAGSAGMLINRRVLEKIGDPWFTPGPGAQGLNEDLEFCRKAREAGFKIYCDPAVGLGHITLTTVWPHWQDGEWQVSLQVSDQENIPIRRLPSKEDAAVPA